MNQNTIFQRCRNRIILPAGTENLSCPYLEDQLDVSSETTVCLSAVLDLAERKTILADIGLKANARWWNNIQGDSRSMTLLGKSLTEIVKPNLYDLFSMPAQARGRLVEKEEEADVVFSADEGTPFEIEKITSQFL